jgi:hypothetical protein
METHYKAAHFYTLPNIRLHYPVYQSLYLLFNAIWLWLSTAVLHTKTSLKYSRIKSFHLYCTNSMITKPTKPQRNVETDQKLDSLASTAYHNFFLKFILNIKFNISRSRQGSRSSARKTFQSISRIKLYNKILKKLCMSYLMIYTYI